MILTTSSVILAAKSSEFLDFLESLKEVLKDNAS